VYLFLPEVYSLYRIIWCFRNLLKQFLNLGPQQKFPVADLNVKCVHEFGFCEIESLTKYEMKSVEVFPPLCRLRWSRGSVLAFGTQVRGFKPGRSRPIFKGEKILSTPSFGGEVKASLPCRRFAACKRSLELGGSRILDEICRNISRPRRVPPSTARGLSRRWT